VGQRHQAEDPEIRDHWQEVDRRCRELHADLVVDISAQWFIQDSMELPDDITFDVHSYLHALQVVLH
jgi:aromatic ring-opening dioxygenase catalytic subunit (LigB family)